MNNLHLYASTRFHNFPKSITKTFSLRHDNKESPWLNYKILDPQSDFVNRWNHIFLVTCIVALFLDPLYFYLPVIPRKACVSIDFTLGFVATLLRTMVDVSFLLHIFVKFKIAFVAPSSRVVGRGDLVRDPIAIAKRYLRSDFIVDLAATLPLPQIVIWFVIVAPASDQTPDNANNSISLIVLIQLIPRLFILFRLHERIMKTAGVIAKTSWSGSAFTLLFYMLASHVIGSAWYLLSFQRQQECWRSVCDKERNLTHSPSCVPLYLDCSVHALPERNAWLKDTVLFTACDANGEDTYPFGIYADASSRKVAETDFINKYFYCLWWGLKNLSSYGQNLRTSTYVNEIVFSMFICILGLTLFSYLLGRMQNYVQSTTAKIEEWRIRRRDTEEWMRHRQLPEELRERVRRFVQYKWIATRGVDEESILQSLPLDLRRTIQRHLCLAFVRRVPFFAQMDQQLLDAICERLYSSLHTRETYILREGDPVNEMIFIIRGQVESSTTNGGRTGFYNSITLKTGDFCGEELLTWALLPISSLNLPLSTRTVKSLTEVEAFALRAEDLKFVSSQFKRLHSKRLQHAFRYYSHQWRGWGASFIQTAWRRYRRRKEAVKLAILEGFYDNVENEDTINEESAGGRTNYEADTGAERSAVENASDGDSTSTALLTHRLSKRRGVSLRVAAFDPDHSSLKMPKMFKPTDPDFSADYQHN